MLRTLQGCALLSALALAGCDRGQTPVPTPVSAEPARPEGAPSPAPAPQLEQRITWPAAARIDAAALAELPPATADAVRGSPVPVLVPARSALLAAAVLVLDEHWYAFSARADGLTVSLSATRIAHSHPDIPPARGTHDVRGTRGFATENEGIQSVTWIENGASYTLEIECSTYPEPRCASDALVLELARELVYVGGAGAGGRP